MPARISITYVSGPSGIVDTNTGQSTQTGCPNADLGTGNYIALSPNSTGETHTFDVNPQARCWAQSFTARSGTDAIHALYRYSQLGDFSDAVVLQDSTVLVGGPGASTIVSFNVQGPVGICAYGTEKKPGVSEGLLLTPNFLGGLLAEAGLPGALLYFAAYLYGIFSVNELCSQLPPVPQQGLLIADWGARNKQTSDALAAILWPALCQCKAGTPVAPPPPPPVLVVPPGAPVQPPFTVTTPGDPAALSEILRRLSEIQQTVGSDLAMDTLVQRWQSPFGYIYGPLHEGLTGEGAFGVERVLGLLVTVTQLPEVVHTSPGNPIYLRDLGWLAIDDGGAMLQELRVTRQQQTWYPRYMELANRVSWSLKPDVEIAVQELRAEP